MDMPENLDLRLFRVSADRLPPDGGKSMGLVIYDTLDNEEEIPDLPRVVPPQAPVWTPSTVITLLEVEQKAVSDLQSIPRKFLQVLMGGLDGSAVLLLMEDPELARSNMIEVGHYVTVLGIVKDCFLANVFKEEQKDALVLLLRRLLANLRPVKHVNYYLTRNFKGTSEWARSLDCLILDLKKFVHNPGDDQCWDDSAVYVVGDHELYKEFLASVIDHICGL